MAAEAYCPSCGAPLLPGSSHCPACGRASAQTRSSGSGLAWFFAGTTLSLAILLGLLLWALLATGLYRDLAEEVEALALGRPTATPRAVAQSTSEPTPTPNRSTPAAPPAAEPRTPRPTEAAPTIGLGERLSSADWQFDVVDARQSEGPNGTRVLVDFQLKNDSDRADLLVIPGGLPPLPSLRQIDRPLPSRGEVQLADPPALSLRLLDRAGDGYGGAFVGADGEVSGAYSFAAAPGDAIQIGYAFDAPPAAAGPFRLEVHFGVDAGGASAVIDLEQRSASPTRLSASDHSRVGGPNEAVPVGGLWSFTVDTISVAEIGPDGARDVVVQLSATNNGSRAMVVGGTENDPTGGSRDFYVVDEQLHLAYSSSESMPSTRIPAGATRTVDVRLRAPGDFAAEGPHRVSIVVDPLRDMAAVFRIP